VSDAGPELFVPDGMELEDEDEDEDEDEFEAMLAAKRELMGRMQEGAGMQPDDDDDMDDEEEIDDDDDMAHIWKADAEAEDIAFDDSELADLIADAERGAAKADSKEKKKRGKKAKKSKAAKAEAKADSDSDDAVAFTPMAEPEFVSTKKSKSKKSLALSDADAMLGDSIELADADAGDKDRRKKTLRFHTAKIAATSARRSAARDKRLGGDDDIPYRDRQAARDAALRKNGPRGTEGEDLDGSEWTDSDRKRAREVRDEADADAGDADADDGYYDLVKRRKVAKDEEKAAKHDEFLEDKL
jgi:U3 small nucleolar RNA-associated protein 3